MAIVSAAGQGKPSGAKLSQALIAYGFFRSTYADFDELLSSTSGLAITRDFRALEEGLHSLQCDVPTRLVFPHRAYTVDSLPRGQWVGMSGKGQTAPAQGFLFVMQFAHAGEERVLVILSSVAPERTTIFWVEEDFSTKLIYDSFTRGDISNDPSTGIGATVAVNLEKNGDVLLREWAEPGSRGNSSGALGRVFHIDMKRGLVTLKGVSQENSLCMSEVLPSALQEQLWSEFTSWRILEPSDLGHQVAERWNAEKPLRCPGLAVGQFDGTRETSYAVFLVSKASPKTSYRILIFSHKTSQTSHESQVLDQSDEGGADNHFIRSVEIKAFFDEDSRKKFMVNAREALLVVFASEAEYQADLYFRTDNRFQREPIDY